LNYQRFPFTSNKIAVVTFYNLKIFCYKQYQISLDKRKNHDFELRINAPNFISTYDLKHLGVTSESINDLESNLGVYANGY
jgi:hypothetical protein